MRKTFAPVCGATYNLRPMKEKMFNFIDLPFSIVEGNVKRRIFSGEKMMLVHYEFPPHKTFPTHSHDAHEQMGYVLKGKLKFILGKETRIIEEGDCYYAPIGVPHGCETLDEPVILLDVFSPPREDLVS